MTVDRSQHAYPYINADNNTNICKSLHYSYLKILLYIHILEVYHSSYNLQSVEVNPIPYRLPPISISRPHSLPSPIPSACIY